MAKLLDAVVKVNGQPPLLKSELRKLISWDDAEDDADDSGTMPDRELEFDVWKRTRESKLWAIGLLDGFRGKLLTRPLQQLEDMLTEIANDVEVVKFNRGNWNIITQSVQYTTGIQCSDPLPDREFSLQKIPSESFDAFFKYYKGCCNAALFIRTIHPGDVIYRLFDSILKMEEFGGKFDIDRGNDIEGPEKDALMVSGKIDLLVSNVIKGQRRICAVIRVKSGPTNVETDHIQAIAPAAIIHSKTNKPVWAIHTNVLDWRLFKIENNETFCMGSVDARLIKYSDDDVKKELKSVYQWVYSICKDIFKDCE